MIQYSTKNCISQRNLQFKCNFLNHHTVYIEIWSYSDEHRSSKILESTTLSGWCPTIRKRSTQDSSTMASTRKDPTLDKKHKALLKKMM